MSTKIFGGRIVRKPIGIVIDLLLETKPEIAQKARKLELAWMAHQISRQIDIRNQNGPDAMLHAWTSLLDAVNEIKKTGRRNPACDYSFEVTLFPDGEETLLVYNCEQKSLTDILDNMSEIEDFSYWDNTDPDETVSAEEWNIREEKWNKFLKAGMAPSDKGVFMTMYNHEMISFPKADEIVEYIPPRKSRAYEICKTRYFTNYEKNIRAENPDITNDEITRKIINKVFSFEKTNISQKDIDDEVGNITNIDLDYLKGNSNESCNCKSE